jgi:hypothetical protein
MYVELLFYCSMVREIVIYNDRVHDFITCSSFLCYVLSSAQIHIKVYLYKIFVLYCFNPTIKHTWWRNVIQGLNYDKLAVGLFVPQAIKLRVLFKMWDTLNWLYKVHVYIYIHKSRSWDMKQNFRIFSFLFLRLCAGVCGMYFFKMLYL